jgi:isoleucyl-tRNA synthetase
VGWDCHGLPIENIVEKEMGSKAKKDIEALGVEKFNELCRSKVLEYVGEWKKIIKRFGRWADMENAYKTMDPEFMESVWWVFKELYNKGLIYEGYRSMHICPRCETTLSQSEVAEGYRDIKDLSATAKFELVSEPGTFVLAWTTTPWTLIGNVALAVGSEIDYAKVESEGKKYILAKERVEDVFSEKEYETSEVFRGTSLIGKEYVPIFDYYAKEEKLENHENGWKIYAADFVTTEDGTGVVHIAPAFGEDDMNLGKKEKLPFVQHVGMDGVLKAEAGEFAGLHVKPIGDTQKTDVEIIKYLAHKELLFAKEKYEHSYPHCWRCDTPLLNYATSSWFVSVEKIKERMLELAKEINWSPNHMKNGRFGNWLEGARDWSISRQRFWASVIPVWRCDKCNETLVVGSTEELEKLSGERVTDLHKHVVDKVTFHCDRCEGTMKRVSDVLDTWFDSGSMPYAQMHYPFENQEKFEKGFPANFIAEGDDQTRAWFYYLHVIATGVKDSRAFSNVVVNGIVLAEDGKKMAKRLKNYPDPAFVLEKYGADPLRFYLLTSPVMQAENLNFKETELADLVRGMFRMLWNSYSFFVLYAEIDNYDPAKAGELGEKNNLLDKWIISELQLLIKDVNQNMEIYELTRAARLFPKFIDNLSNWYIRRSRKRLWKSENDGDKKEAYDTLHYVLVTLSKLMAPFTPFVSEEMYKNLTGEESVHLVAFPETNENLTDEKLNQEMSQVRNIISEGLQLRAKSKIKVRQPLHKVAIKSEVSSGELLSVIKEELNVKEVVINKEMEGEVSLDTEITPELKLEGIAREIIRSIQAMRKEAGYEVDNRIYVGYNGLSDVFENPELGSLIAKETLANGILRGMVSEPDLVKEFSIEGRDVAISIKR